MKPPSKVTLSFEIQGLTEAEDYEIVSKKVYCGIFGFNKYRKQEGYVNDRENQ